MSPRFPRKAPFFKKNFDSNTVPVSPRPATNEGSGDDITWIPVLPF